MTSGPVTFWIPESAGSETTIATAATADIGSLTSPRALITGAGTITSFGSQPNRLRFVRFDSAVTLTHNPPTLNMPFGANIVTTSGDGGMAMSDINGNWTYYQLTASAATVNLATSLVDLSNPINVTADTVIGTNINKFYNCTPPGGTIKNLQFPSAALNPGAKIFVRVTDAAPGMMRMKSTPAIGDSIIYGWPNDTVLLVNGESLLLESLPGSGWIIVSHVRRAITGKFKRSNSAGNIALTNDNAWKTVTFDTVLFGALGTQWGAGNLALSGGSFVIPRRGRWQFNAKVYCENNVDIVDTFQMTFTLGVSGVENAMMPQVSGSGLLSATYDQIFNEGDVIVLSARSTNNKAGTLKTNAAGFEPICTVTEIPSW